MVKKIILMLTLTLTLLGCNVASQKFTVTLDANGGNLRSGSTTSFTVENGDKISELENPSREGYTFGGWYLDSELSTPYVPDTIVASDMTIYARWEPKELTVTFDAADAENASDFSAETIAYMDCATEPETKPVKQGMNFDGWFTDAECTTPFSFDTKIVDNTTLYAGFSSSIYDLTKLDSFVFQSQVRDPYVWMGCETAALMMALKTTGHIRDMAYTQMLNELPMTDSDNPYLGFCGNLYSDTWMRDAVMPNIIAEWGQQYGNTKDITKQGLEPLIEALKNGHPVVVWTSSRMVPSETVWDDSQMGTTDDAVDPLTGETLNYFGSTGSHWEYKTHNHVMTLVGYNSETQEFELADPAEWLGPTYWVTYDTFMNSWNCYQGAVEVW